MILIDFEFRKNIVYEIINLAKTNVLSNEDKTTFYKIVYSLKNRTDIQKHRFCLLYNLYTDRSNTYSLSDISRKYNVRPSAVKQSTARVRNALINSNSEDLMTLFKILKKYSMFLNID